MTLRRPSPVDRPVVLSIAGSDSGGGAGIQADIKAIEAAGGFAATAVTAVTAQNTLGVDRIDVLDPDAVTAQIEAVLDDIRVDAVKTGMLANRPVVRAVADAIEAIDVPLIVDPVMVAASGDRLLEEDAVAAYDRLLDRATVVTPNADEATLLTGIEIGDLEGAHRAAERLIDGGVRAALVKGGHWGSGPIHDILALDGSVETIVHSRVDTGATHGSGCTLASVIATHLAAGEALDASVHAAVETLERAVRYHHDVGAAGAVHHLVSLRADASTPPTVDAVRTVVDWFVDERAVTLVPEVGTNVVGATPYAERPDELVGLDGRLVRADGAVVRAGELRPGGSSHVARLLLAAREHDPRLRFAANCRAGESVRDAMDALDWDAVMVDRRGEPEDVGAEEGRTMSWVVDAAFERSAGTPVAIHDLGANGKEPMTRVLAESASELRGRLASLADELSA